MINVISDVRRSETRPAPRCRALVCDRFNISWWRCRSILKIFHNVIPYCCNDRENSLNPNLRQCQNLTREVFHGRRYRLLVWPWNLLQGHRGWRHGQNTYDFLLVFYSYVGRIPYRFCATVDFMLNWPCWATVTSKWQWRSIHITPKMKSLGQDLPHVNSCITFYVRQTEW